MRRWFVIGALILSVLAIGVVVSRSGGGSSVGAERSFGPGYGSSFASEGTSVASAANLAAARRAGMAAVALTGEVAAAGYISRRDLIGTFATPEFGSRLADTTSDQLRALAN